MPGRFVDYMDTSYSTESAQERAYLRAPLRLQLLAAFGDGAALAVLHFGEVQPTVAF